MLNLGTQNAPALWLSCARAATIHGTRLASVTAAECSDEHHRARNVAAGGAPQR